MENSVTLDLKTYADMVIEIQNFKNAMKSFRKAFETELDFLLNDNDYDLTHKDMDGLNAILDEKDDRKVFGLAGLWYGRDFKRIVQKYEGIYGESDIFAYLAEEIKAVATDRINEIGATE